MAQTGHALVVAAIDFGTTFSGYAFSFRHEFETDPLRVNSSQWSTGSRVSISLKTSTCVLFGPDRRFHSFGFEAEDKYSDLSYDGEHTAWYYFRRFKMLLYDTGVVHRNTMITEESGKQMPAMTVFSATIRYLTEHLLDAIGNRDYDIRKDEVKWVLTVPAIWNDAAKQFTREAAEQAGIRGDKLVLALEPEAASMFCKYLPVERINDRMRRQITCFQPKSKYLVLDAGGGTVDITVHEVQDNGTLHELFKANGGPWGGTSIDQEFLKFLERIVGERVLEKFRQENTDDYIDLLREFEIKKRSVSPTLDSRMTFKIPISLLEIYRDVTAGELRKAVKDLPELDGKITFAGDKLRADPEVVQSLFRKTCNEVVSHLHKILNDPQTKGTSSILMVGGFSESPMIRHAVEEAFPDKRVISPHEAGLAVLKGAVIFGHNENVITQRISKFTYGLKVRGRYNPNKHSTDRMYIDDNREKMVHGVFDKLVEVGQPVSADKPCLGKTMYTPSGKGYYSFGLKLFASPDKNPVYVDDEGCINVGEVLVDCRNRKGGVSGAYVNLIFGKTELEVEAVNAETGEKTNASFNFLD